MNIAVLGTGTVGRTLSAALVALGHTVVVGTRDPAATLARTDPDRMGNPPFRVWLDQNPRIRLAAFAEAAASGELVINATNGDAFLAALRAAGEPNLSGKVLVDVANPLDFSHGMPPTLLVSNTDSLAEQIQRAFPAARVVKTLNTTTAPVMVNPRQVAGGDHTVFLSGDDPAAKEQVAGLLRGFGWVDIIDLGGLYTARGAEMVLPVWLSLMGLLRTPMFNFKIVR